MVEDHEDHDDAPLSERRRLTCLEFAMELHAPNHDTAAVLVAAKAFEEFLLGEEQGQTIQ